MSMRSRIGWLCVHAAPIVVIPAAAALFDDVTAGARAVVCYALLLAIVAGGQAAVVARADWAWFTAAGLAVAWLVGGAAITLLDPILHAPEPVLIPIAHGACGFALGVVQSRALPAARGRWIAASAASWAIGSALVFPLWDAHHIPGNVRGLFPGSAEMTTLIRLLPVYAVGMLPIALGRMSM